MTHHVDTTTRPSGTPYPPPEEPPFDPDYDAPPPAAPNGHIATLPAPDPVKAAEQALLGHLITDPALAPHLAPELDPGDFYQPGHELLWNTIHTLHEQGTTPDHLAVVTHLTRTGQLRQAGGDAYLLQLRDAVRLVADPATAAATIRDAARLRTLTNLGTKLRQIGETGRPDQVDDALALAVDTLDQAATRFGPRTDHQTLNSWTALDLEPVLAGGEIDPPPTMLARTDGNHLLYDHAVHSISGEPTSGKTWFALLAATQQLSLGAKVAMVDFEDRASRVIGRLLALGAHPDTVRDNFAYIRPHTALDNAGRQAIEPSIRDATLVILDGVTEAMTLHGLDLSSNTDVAAFLELLPRWIADHGPAVLLIDHVVKDTEKQGRWAIGGQHKLAGLDGVAYTIKAVEQFGRGKVGHARITAGKDRAGHVEEYLTGRVAGELWLDARNDTALLAEIRPAEDVPKDQAGNMRPTVLMERVSRWLELTPNANRNSITDGVTGKATYVRRALDRLIQEGYVEVTAGPNRQQIHRVTSPFRNDPQETLT